MTSSTVASLLQNCSALSLNNVLEVNVFSDNPFLRPYSLDLVSHPNIACMNRMLLQMSAPNSLWVTLISQMRFFFVVRRIECCMNKSKQSRSAQYRSRMTSSVSSATRTVFFVASCLLHCCLRNQQVGILLRVLCEASSKLHVLTQHVDEVLFVVTFERKTSFDIVNFISPVKVTSIPNVPLMCCVLGGWNALTIEDYDGGPQVSRHIVTVEGAYILICWEPMPPCYTMEQ